MAFIRVDPVEVQVRTNWFNGRPREITWGDERLPITRLAAVREEAAAYPVITGPRTLFEVDTPRARLSLIFQHRSRRWTVNGLDRRRPHRQRRPRSPTSGGGALPPPAGSSPEGGEGAPVPRPPRPRRLASASWSGRCPRCRSAPSLTHFECARFGCSPPPWPRPPAPPRQVGRPGPALEGSAVRLRTPGARALLLSLRLGLDRPGRRG